MAERKTPEEKLQELEKKMAQLKAQKQAIIAKENKEKRAKRTRRLIQIGALSEKYFNCPDIEPEQYEKLVSEIVKTTQVNTLISGDVNV